MGSIPEHPATERPVHGPYPDAPPDPIVDEEYGLIVDGDIPKKPKPKTSSASGAILAATMLGLGEIIEPEKAKSAEIAEVEAADDNPLGGFNFGDLPPLN